MAVSQGARIKVNKPVTSQVVVHLLHMLDEVTEELQWEESMEEPSSVEKVHEIVEEFQESPQWLMTCYQPEVYFMSEIEDKNQRGVHGSCYSV